jgi:peroxiredoxin
MSEPESPQTDRKHKRLLRWLAEGLLFLLIIYLIHLWQIRESVEGPAPQLSSQQLLNGGTFEIHKRPKEPLLVYFWASWCPVCGLSSGNIDALSKEHAVVTVAMQSGEPAEVARHLTEKGLKFPVIVDSTGEIARSWGVHGVPTLYVLDAENRIRFVSVGYTSTPGLITRMWFAGK